MTNRHDVSLLSQSSVQQRIARSIADGLRRYVEGNPRQDTRRVNPRRPVAEPFAADASAGAGSGLSSGAAAMSQMGGRSRRG